MAIIEQLPWELLRAFTKHLPRKDLSALSCASKTIRTAVEPTLYREITFNWERNSKNHPPVHLLLRCIVSRPDLASCIERLNFCGQKSYSKWESCAWRRRYKIPTGQSCSVWTNENKRQNIVLKVTAVSSDLDGCPGSNYVLAADDCKNAFHALNNDCDTSTRTEKKGGIFNYKCLKYNLSGTGTPNYRPGSCGLHIIQYQKPDPSKDAYTLDVQLKDADSMIIGNTLGAVDARNPISVSGFGGQLPVQLIVTAGGVDADPVKFTYGDQI